MKATQTTPGKALVSTSRGLKQARVVGAPWSQKTCVANLLRSFMLRYRGDRNRALYQASASSHRGTKVGVFFLK